MHKNINLTTEIPELMKYVDSLPNTLTIHEHKIILRGGQESNFYIDFKTSFSNLLKENSFNDEENSLLLNIYHYILEDMEKFESLNLNTSSENTTRYFVGMGISGVCLVSSFITYYYKKYLEDVKNYLKPEIQHLIIRKVLEKHMITKVINVHHYLKQRDIPLIYILDDVMTTGGTIKEIIKELIDSGIKKKDIKQIYILFSRNPEIKEIEGIPVKSLFHVESS